VTTRRLVPNAKFKAPRIDHHTDGSLCPKEHTHTVSNKPTHPDCSGRAYSTATCTCGWSTKNPGRGFVDETRRRHLNTEHPKPANVGPKILRDLLRLDLR
jgi:hypothetical protein